MNAGKTIEFFTKQAEKVAEELKPEEKPVTAPKVDQTVETKTDDTQKIESDKAEQPGENGTDVKTVKDEIKEEEKAAEEKVAAVTAKDVANMLASLAKNPTNTGVVAGAGLGSILAALGSISRSNDPKKKKSIATNPALLGALGTGIGYMGGNYLEGIKPQDVQEAKERVFQQVNKGLEVASAKAKDVLNLSGLKNIPSETAGDLKQTAKETLRLGKNVLKSDVGALGVGGLSLSALAKRLAFYDRLDVLKRINPELHSDVLTREKILGSIDNAVNEFKIPSMQRRIGFGERLQALIDPMSREGRQWASQLVRSLGLDGKLKNSATLRKATQEIALKKELHRLKTLASGNTAGLLGSISQGKAIQKSHQLEQQLKALHASGLGKMTKALNFGSKSMQILGRAINPHRGLKGKAAVLGLLASLGYGYKRMKDNGGAK